MGFWLVLVSTTGLIFLLLLQAVELNFFDVSLSLFFSAVGGVVAAVFWEDVLKQFFEPDTGIEEEKQMQKSRTAEHSSFSSSGHAHRDSSAEDSLEFAEVAQYASAVFGVDLTKPYSESAPEFLSFVPRISTAPGSMRTESPTPHPSKSFNSEVTLSRLRYLQLCLKHLDSLTLEDLELLYDRSEKDIPELSDELSKRRQEIQEITELDQKRVEDTFQKMRSQLVKGTNLDIPIDESDEEWVTQALRELVLDEESETSMAQFLVTGLFASLNPVERQSFAEIRAKFRLWEGSVQKQEWDAIGGPNSGLAKKAVAEAERQRLEDQAAEAKLGEERARAQKLEALSEGLINLFREQKVLHKKLLKSLDTCLELSLVSERAKWLHERERPAPQPYGVSAMGAEALIADWLAYLGETGVEQTQYVGDGGVDVFTDDLCVQVKNYEKQTVSSSETRDVFGTATSEGLRACIFTSSKLSADALEFAERNSIIAIYYNAPLSALIALTSSAEDLLSKGEYEEA